jgi:glycerol-3-phosphate dehydrogenase (NAD(P)+)
MRITFLGSGAWASALATLLCRNGHRVTMWSQQPELAHLINQTHIHPRLPQLPLNPALHCTADWDEALAGAEIICEAVTSAGVRPVFHRLNQCAARQLPIIMTSKGIEQHSCLLLPEVVQEILGPGSREQIALLSGPSYAEEVLRGVPTTVVATGYSGKMRELTGQLFGSPVMRIYPNADLCGVAIGGALKNVIAIAAGISDGMGFGMNTKAALMTRGLHEIKKLAVARGALPETLNGLAGMGDLVVTCMSALSRNYRFGELLAAGLNAEEAKQKIGMAVEGAYTCISALQLAAKEAVPMPICQSVEACMHQALPTREAVERLMVRAIKEEHL